MEKIVVRFKQVNNILYKPELCCGHENHTIPLLLDKDQVNKTIAKLSLLNSKIYNLEFLKLLVAGAAKMSMRRAIGEIR